jgi:hypothetical protein
VVFKILEHQRKTTKYIYRIVGVTAEIEATICRIPVYRFNRYTSLLVGTPIACVKPGE